MPSLSQPHLGSIVDQTAYRWGAACMLGAAAIILMALGFEHIGGYRPCPLCLQERYAYYFGIPAIFLALVLLAMERHQAAGLLLLVVGVAFLANAGLGVYHAGAELKLWAGPETCAGAPQVAGDVGSLMERMKRAQVVRCDQPEIWILGLSFAGWNALISFALAIGSIRAAFAAGETERDV